jgi:hypothetical protein
MDENFPFATEVFNCLHQQTSDLFHQCANMAWLAKGNPLNIILGAFYR